MQTTWITLPSSLNDDLKWEKEKNLAIQAIENGSSIYWHIDFRWDKDKISLSDPPYFLTYGCSLEHFTKTLWPLFGEKTLGLCIYKGDINFSEKFIWKEADQENFQEWLLDIGKENNFTPFDYRVYCANVFGEYLARLISYLPDSLKVFGVFEPLSSIDPAKAAVLLSQERFPHLTIGCPKEVKESLAICLPPDSYLSHELFTLLDHVFETLTHPYRILSESRLTEEWDGVDTLIVFSSYITNQGKRKLQGFNAAIGKIVYVGDPLGFENEISYDSFVQ